MARPSVEALLWASTTNHPAGAGAWNGQPTKVLPSGGQIAAGFNPGFKFPSEWLNYVLANDADWIRYLDDEQLEIRSRIVDDEWTYPTPKAREVWYGLGSSQNYWNNTGWSFSFSSNTLYRFSAAPGVGERFVIYIDPPPGSVITGYKVRWKPGVTGRTGSNRMSTVMYGPTGTLLSPAGAPSQDTGVNTLYNHAIDMSGAPHTVDRTTPGSGYQILIQGGTGGASVSDEVWGYALLFNDTGPKNGD